MDIRDILLIVCVLISVGVLILWMRREKMVLAPLSAVLILIGSTVFHFTFRTELKAEECEIELGTQADEDPAAYLDGMEWAIPYSKVDTRSVNIFEVGTYDIKITHGRQHFTVRAVVRDTTPPELTLKSGDFYLEKGKRYRAGYFVKEASDISGGVELGVCGRRGGKEGKTITYTSCGTYTLFVRARDGHGNVTDKELTVVVDTPPEFGIMKDYYLALGTQIDYLEQGSAYDEVDGDVSDQIRVNAVAVRPDTVGDYPITYFVTDSFGLTNRVSATVHVYTPTDLQELINTHQISLSGQIIAGAPNPYDMGVYEEDDVPFVLEVMRPAVVRLQKEGELTYSWGSGYIIEITDEEVIICTNAHVVGGYETMDAYFHDGTKVQAEILGKAGETITEKDIAFVRVARADLPEELVSTLRTVHIDKDYWESLSNRPDIEVGFSCAREDGSLWAKRAGLLLYKETVKEEFLSYGTFSEIGIVLEEGMSGSAVVDGHGNLMGMAVSITWDTVQYQYWAVTLENILEAYEEILGRNFYY